MESRAICRPASTYLPEKEENQMDRFTERQQNGQIILNCRKCGLDTPEKPCTALTCRNRLQERLAEYEDSGLEPAAVLEMAENTESRALTWFEAKYGICAGRMMELAEADREGRVKILSP